MVVDREAIKRLAGPRFRTVEVPDLGTVRVRIQTGAERERLELAVRRAVDARSPGKVRAMRAAAIVVDESGDRLYSADNPADLAELAGLPWVALDQIIEAGESSSLAQPEVAVDGKAPEPNPVV